MNIMIELNVYCQTDANEESIKEAKKFIRIKYKIKSETSEKIFDALQYMGMGIHVCTNGSLLIGMPFQPII
ncbi:MAG: hypothetical protein ACE5J4_02410 [Candidatus Aenigmatarchaeota archaeon]